MASKKYKEIKNLTKQEAEEKYLTAIKLNPANAQYLSGYGDFLRNKSAYQENPIVWLSKAEKLYERVLKLNSRGAKSYLNLGQAQLALFLKDKQKYADKLNSALGNFKKALREDPNGFNISYSVAYACILIWQNLDNNWRELVLDRLQYVIDVRLDYFAYIYPRLWEATRDIKLLQRIRPKEPQKERKEKLKKIAKIKEAAKRKPGLAGRQAQTGNMIFRADWQGTANDGKNIYNQGNMYWSGAIYAPVYAPAGEAVVKIQALGQKARGIYPYMIVELDGEEIGETFVDSAEWKEYTFAINSGIPRLHPSMDSTDSPQASSELRSGLSSVAVSVEPNVLSVTFLNDYCTEKEDRNLIVGEARVDER